MPGGEIRGGIVAMSDPLTSSIDFIRTTIDKIFPDANQKAQALAALDTLKETNEFQVQLANLAINLQDAKGNWFQSGWRPALAWSCVLAFVYHFFLWPVLVAWMPVKDIQSQDFVAMMGVLTILIGARSVDKWKGSDSK